ncbi:MAG: hypothetical protein R3C59_20915 [Planctomycetaceae bacterium]
MSANEKISVGDLLDEGRRFVLEVGEYYEGDGFRAIIVFEDHPGYFPSGERTNREGAAPVLWWPTDDRDSAQKMAYSHSEKVLGLSRMDHLRIVGSSIGAQHKACEVVVEYDPGTGDTHLRNGYGVEMRLAQEQAVALYQNLARTLELPCRGNCSECGSLLEYDDTCGWCDLDDAS